MNGLTARRSLDLLELQPGQILAVTGAAGAYGGYVVQLAKAAGLVVVADASDADRALVSTLGADAVLPRGEGFTERYASATPTASTPSPTVVQNEAVIATVHDGGAFTSVRAFEAPPRHDVPAFSVTWVRDACATARPSTSCAGRPRPGS